MKFKKVNWVAIPSRYSVYNFVNFDIKTTSIMYCVVFRFWKLYGVRNLLGYGKFKFFNK